VLNKWLYEIHGATMKKLYMFRTVPLSIIRIFSLHTQQWYMSCRFAGSLRAGSGWNQLRPDLAVCTVKISWWRTKELSETCRVWFQNKFEKLVHLVGFIIRIRHDARSPERKNRCCNRCLSLACVCITSLVYTRRIIIIKIIISDRHASWTVRNDSPNMSVSDELAPK